MAPTGNDTGAFICLSLEVCAIKGDRADGGGNAARPGEAVRPPFLAVFYFFTFTETALENSPFLPLAVIAWTRKYIFFPAGAFL